MDTRPIRSRMTEMLVIGALLFPTELMADARSPVKLLLDSAQTRLQAQAVNSLVTKLERERRGTSVPEFQSQRSALTSEARLETGTLPPTPASFPAAVSVSAASTEPPQASDTEPSAPGSGAETSVIRPGQNSLALTDSKIEPQTFPAAALTPSKSPAEIANAVPTPKPIAQRAEPELPADKIRSASVATPQEAIAPSMASVSKPLPRADTTAPKNQKTDRTETEKLPKPLASSRTALRAEGFVPELDARRIPKRYRRMLEAYGL
jgi:hypothetical protein